MSHLNKGQSARSVFKSGPSYSWQQPFGTNIHTQSRSSKSKTWTRPASNTAPATQSQISPAACPSSQSQLKAGSVPTDTKAQWSQHGLAGPTAGQTLQVSLLGLSDKASIDTLSDTNPETRRLIHKGRYKLVQPIQQTSSSHTQHTSSAQQHRSPYSITSRKRALPVSSTATEQAAKRRRTWVRTGVLASSQGASSAVPSESKPSTPIFVRSKHCRKLQLVRKLSSSPASTLSKHLSRNAALAKRLLSARPLKSVHRLLPNAKTPGIAKPGKLQRIGGVLYKVGGSRLNRSLQRQLTPQVLKTNLTSEVCLVFAFSFALQSGTGRPHLFLGALSVLILLQAAYVQHGNHLVLRCLLPHPHSLVRKARPVGSKVSASPFKPADLSHPAQLSSKPKSRLNSLRVTRKPNKLCRSRIPAQTHCLTYCRTGQCKEQQAGKCNLIHDPAAVAVCPAWLQGTCSNAACKLQHCKCPDVMPVCIFYLQGLCTTEDCPYAHVKVDPLAPVCQDFVRGHCPRGCNCTKKHLAPRMIRQLRQSKALQASFTSQKPTEQVSKTVAAAADDVELRPSFLRAP